MNGITSYIEDVRRLGSFAVHVDGEAGVLREERLLSFGASAVGAVCVRVEQLAQGEPVGGFSGHGWSPYSDENR
jgi:hypothetical protein